MFKVKRKILILGIFFLFLVGVYLWQGIYQPKNRTLTEEKLFLVKKGESAFEIGEDLEKEGLIKNRFFFDLYVLTKGIQKRLQAGKYFLSPSMNIPEIAKKLFLGETATMIVTIPEGFTVRQIEEKLNFKLPGKNLEGFLFPDTYYFPIDVSPKEVVRKMRENFEKKMETPYPQLGGLSPKEAAAQQGKEIREIIIMASLIEKEVFNTKECRNCKNLVSGILWKRLKNGIPLQVDATITYITGKKTTKISIEDTKIDNPYNTYKYLGLPPGPICNPGLESIFAALLPEESPYWYYLSTPDGKTIFSKTLKEHTLAKAIYLR